MLNPNAVLHHAKGIGRRGKTEISREIIDAVGMLVRICPADVIAGVLNRNGVLLVEAVRFT